MEHHRGRDWNLGSVLLIAVWACRKKLNLGEPFLTYNGDDHYQFHRLVLKMNWEIVETGLVPGSL